MAEFSGRHSRWVWLGFTVANVGKSKNVVLGGGEPLWGRFGYENDDDAPPISNLNNPTNFIVLFGVIFIFRICLYSIDIFYI